MLYAIAAAALIGVVIIVERALFLFRSMSTHGEALERAAQLNPRDVEAALDEVLLRATPRLEARTGYLEVLAKSTCLVGVLGTVHTLIDALRPSGSLTPVDRGTVLAATMAEALEPTVLSLTVSLVLMVCYALLTARSQAVLAELHCTAASLRRRYLR